MSRSLLSDACQHCYCLLHKTASLHAFFKRSVLADLSNITRWFYARNMLLLPHLRLWLETLGGRDSPEEHASPNCVTNVHHRPSAKNMAMRQLDLIESSHGFSSVLVERRDGEKCEDYSNGEKYTQHSDTCLCVSLRLSPNRRCDFEAACVGFVLRAAVPVWCASACAVAITSGNNSTSFPLHTFFTTSLLLLSPSTRIEDDVIWCKAIILNATHVLLSVSTQQSSGFSDLSQALSTKVYQHTQLAPPTS
uniref:Fe2OG dioxygenase domain-containing protein n=1 Tax=Echinococcus granulosus TaxID=6210 RepID=U6FTA4_ECHGR|nr:hypothetical protein EgrG_002066700 [Echinococcus granulosus]